MPGRTSNTGNQQGQGQQQRRQQRQRVEQTTTPMIDLSKTVEPGLEETTTPAFEKPDQDEYGNKLVYLGYRKEDYFCPEGYVLDIYGYCRYVT